MVMDSWRSIEQPQRDLGSAWHGLGTWAAAARAIRAAAQMCTSAQGWQLLLYLLAMGALAGEIGPIPRPVGRLVAFVASALLVSAASAPLWTRALGLGWRDIVATGAWVGGAGALGVLLSRGLGGVVGLLVPLAVVDELLRRRALGPRVLPLVLTTVLWIGLTSGWRYSTYGWQGLSGVTKALLVPSEVLIRRPFALGPTAAGSRIVLLFALLGLATHTCMQQRSGRRLTGYLAALLAVQTLYVGLLGSVEMGMLKQPTWLRCRPTLADGQCLLLLGLCASACAFWGRASVCSSPPSCGHWRRLAAWGLGVLAGLVLMVPALEAPRVGDIAFLIQSEEVPSSTWSSPQPGSYDKLSGGRYGELPVYLRSMGFRSRFVPSPVTADELRGAATLVSIMPYEAFSQDERETIWQHVHRGASLLVLGDHTGGQSFTQHINQLLHPVRIRLNSDSGWPQAGHWRGQLELRPHGVNTSSLRLREGAGTGISVGGTLAVSWPAEPVLIGRHGWADHANPLNVKGGALGDSRRDVDERLGDVVLCAAAPYGSGKVLVFGDTSSFQNTSLAATYEFVRDVFAWLQNGVRPSLLRGNTAVAILLAVAALWMLRGVGPTPRWLLALGVALGLLDAVSFAARSPVKPAAGSTDKPIAVVDYSHLNLSSEGSYQENADWGLVRSLMRNGYLPLGCYRFDQATLQPASALVMHAPLEPLSAGDVALCDRWVTNGGRLLLAVGYEQRAGSAPLLNHLGVSVMNIPLGRVSVSRGQGQVQLYEAWVLSVSNPRARTVLADETGPVAVEVPVGQGRALIVGDSYFWLNKNLEGLDQYYIGNIEFLRDWLAETAPEGNDG